MGVLATDEEAGIVAGKLTELGGVVELVEVPAETHDAAAAAAESPPEAAPAPAPEGPAATA